MRLSGLMLCLAGCQAAVPSAPTPSALPPPLVQTTPAPAESPLHIMLGLIRHRWQLIDAHDAHGQRIDPLFARADKPLQLQFNASLISLGNTCRVMSAHQRVLPGRLSVAAFDIAPQTCTDPALNRLDEDAAHRLQGELTLQLDAGLPPRLVLTNAAGDVLTFAGLPITTPHPGATP